MQHEIEWNEEKNERNKREKGLTFEVCTDVFGDPESVIATQELQGEVRFKLTGKAQSGIVTVVFTWRGKARRIISAWPASRQERRAYMGR
jgi:uncharacterized DUF497 family protein